MSNYFEIYIEHLKKDENLSARSLKICVENNMQDLQSIVFYFWAYDDFLKLKNCGQKSNLELIELCRKYELTLRKSIVDLFGENPNIRYKRQLVLRYKWSKPLIFQFGIRKSEVTSLNDTKLYYKQ